MVVPSELVPEIVKLISKSVRIGVRRPRCACRLQLGGRRLPRSVASGSPMAIDFSPRGILQIGAVSLRDARRLEFGRSRTRACRRPGLPRCVLRWRSGSRRRRRRGARPARSSGIARSASEFFASGVAPAPADVEPWGRSILATHAVILDENSAVAIFALGAAAMPPHSHTADRNLLFGIIALQMDFISRDQLIAAMQRVGSRQAQAARAGFVRARRLVAGGSRGDRVASAAAPIASRQRRRAEPGRAQLDRSGARRPCAYCRSGRASVFASGWSTTGRRRGANRSRIVGSPDDARRSVSHLAAACARRPGRRVGGARRRAAS